MNTLQICRPAAIKGWSLVGGWMAVIFCFSTSSFSADRTGSFFAAVAAVVFPAATPQQIAILNLMIRKAGHWSEYFILALLIFRALTTTSLKASRTSHAAWSFLIAALFAVSDEWHQSFVPGRTADSFDVLLDSFGALCGVVFIMLWEQTKIRRA